MITSVFFDRKVANEDNPVFEKLELNRAAELDRDPYRYYLPDLTP
jgi:hypothetical protein